MQSLTRLQVKGGSKSSTVLEADALAGMTQMQHLKMLNCRIAGAAVGAAQLLSNLQPLQQLTYLDLSRSLFSLGPYPAAAADSVLTASSNLRQLDIAGCTLPTGVWQHMFPAGRQLLHLRALHISDVRGPSGPSAAPECSDLIRCCPCLQILHMERLQCSAEQLVPLTRLNHLWQLRVRPAGGSSQPGLQGLTRLLQLHLWDDSGDAGLLLQLTQSHMLIPDCQGLHVTAVASTATLHCLCQQPGGQRASVALDCDQLRIRDLAAFLR